MKNLNLIFDLLLFPFLFIKKLSSSQNSDIYSQQGYLKRGNGLSPLILFVFSVFFSTFLSAAVLNTDNFYTGLDGWSGTGISQGTYGSITRMRIDSQRTATKSFNFGSTLANQTLTITFKGYSYDRWESGDTLVTTPGTPSSFFLSYLGSPQEYTFTATADANGGITITLRTNTNRTSERAYIDWIRIEGTPVVGPPVIPNDTFSIDEDANNGATVGTVSTTGGAPTSFTILSGNSDGIFQIDNSGVIAIANNTNLDYETTTSYALEVNASNAQEWDTGTITIDINDVDDTAIAADDSFSTPVDTVLSENVLTNDSGPGITVTSNTEPTNGLLAISSNGDFTYTPGANYSGNDNFDYNITDTDGNTDSATVTILVSNVTIYNGSERPFTIRNPQHTRNLTGDVQVIGNSNQCVTTSTNSFDSVCTQNRSTTANDNMTKYLNTDSGTSGIFNATEATLALDANRTVVWAGLYWQGFMHECSSQTTRTYGNRCRFRDGTATVPTDNSINLSTSSWDTNKVLFKTSSSGSYNTVKANHLDYYYTSNAEGTVYSAYADVTSLLNLKNPNETYSVANIQSMEGRRGYGNYAAWSLFVIYAYDGPGDPFDNEKSRNISVYDGFEVVRGYGYNERVTITPSGFRTPDTGTVDSKLISFAGEGEYGFTPDFIEVNGNRISDGAINPSDNIYNSSISGFTRNPSWANANGIDIDIFDVSAYIPNKATSATITIGSNMDHFYQSVLAFSTELYIPNLCYDYTLDIDGHVLNSINNQIQTPFGGFGEPLTTHLYLRSEEGDLNLADVNISYFILDTSYLHYQDDSTEISETGRFSYEDAAPWTVNETFLGFDMYIGTGATGSSGGIIKPNEDRYIKLDSDFQTNTVNTSFAFAVNYKVDFGSGGVAYHQDFYADDLCPAGSGGFLPELGIFNVVDGGADYDVYNLYTQVSQRPFNLRVYAHDATDPTALFTNANDLNLSVEVEMIRADNFNRDADIACNDEHSFLSDVPAKFVSFSGTESADISYEASDLNLAYRSVAMRVWYLTDPNGNGTLINDHKCTRANQDGCIDLYTRVYSGTDTECSIECTTGSECYDCLRSNHGRMVCSRDNFVIRPESFITEIRDSNQSINIDDPNIHIANSVTDATPFSVIAGYDYRFDINATNHQGNQATPRYIQHFEPGSSTHRARMVPIPSFKTNPVCNDVEDKNISINLFNGSDVNYHPSARTSYIDKVDQIGEYLFEIFDSNWTSADWNSAEMQHHYGSYSAYYDADPDCLNGSDVLATSVAGRNGCEISSFHTNVDTDVVYDYLHAQYYPYKFDVNGLTIGAGPTNDKEFIYINTLTLDTALYPNVIDENMSYNIQGTFFAAGYNNTDVSNFVYNCYAAPVDMILNHTYLSDIPTNTANLTYDLVDYNTSNPSTIIRAREQNTFTETLSKDVEAPLTIQQNPEDFEKTMQGAITMDLGYNFDRVINQELNPRRINFGDFNLSYASSPDINVDLKNDYKIFGDKINDANITFVYGRAKPNKFFYDDVTAGSMLTPVSIVAYCDLGLLECQNRGLSVLATGMLTDAQSNESSWWYSQNHSTAVNNDGQVTLTASGGGTVVPVDATSINLTNGIDSTVLVTNAGGTPNIVDINLGSNTDRWLIYNKDADSIPSPFYRVRFIGSGTWSTTGNLPGVGHVVGDDINTKKAKRVEW